VRRKKENRKSRLSRKPRRMGKNVVRDIDKEEQKLKSEDKGR